MSKKIAVLLMSYGTPNNIDEIWDYYTHIRHGHAPTQALYDELVGRYEEIGGVSPLAQVTEDQRRAVEETLNKRGDAEYEVFNGLRHIRPFIEDVLDEIVAKGFETIHGLVLAPHNSTFIQQYHDRVCEHLADHSEITYVQHHHFWKEEGFLNFWAKQIQATLNPAKKQKFLFTAHSLPERLLANGDPYVDEIKAAAAAIVSHVDGQVDFDNAWQSVGRTADKWIGPNVEDVTEDLILKEGYEEIIYMPFGFVADNLETLYDNDVECKEQVEKLGAEYKRLNMPNDNQVFIDGVVNELTK
ncbi:MAG: ferrochelatase [Lactococcus sp.]